MQIQLVLVVACLSWLLWLQYEIPYGFYKYLDNSFLLDTAMREVGDKRTAN